MSIAWGAGFWLGTHLGVDCNPFWRPWRVDTIFVLTLCCTPDCHCLLERSFITVWYPGCWVRALDFVAPAQRTSPYCLALVAKGLAFLGTTGLVEIGDIVLGRLPPPGTAHTQWTGAHSPAFLWRRPLCSSWSFGLRGRLQVSHIVAYRATLRNIGCGAILALSLCPPPAHQYHQEKSVYTHLEPWFLQLALRGYF